jgi:hypothetical protein
MQDIPVVVWGKGELVKLVHGSGYTDPTFVWSHQRPLAERHQLLVVTRPGYGQRPITPRTHVDQDVQEIIPQSNRSLHERNLPMSQITQQLEAKLAV